MANHFLAHEEEGRFGVIAFEQYYDFREVLAPDKLDRLMALVARREAGEG